jgi:hypothetical protein
MPRKLSRGRRLVTMAGVAAIAALAVPGAAQAAECPVAPTKQAFSAFGDLDSYFLAPGGDFESLDHWTTRGRPRLKTGLNALGLTLGDRSVELSRGESITSAPFCVDRTMPHLRFTGRSIDGDQLDVTVSVTYNGSTDSSGGSVSSSDHRHAFKPSRKVELKTNGIPAGESAMATVRFETGGEWLLDDVHVDPYRR